jgi:serine phosphatase RsbU (regulator of sigma subunit)
VQAQPSARLTIYQPGVPPQQMALPPSTVSLGRASDCTVPMRDRFLSRRHAEIVPDGGHWFVRDLGSVNGTLVNGARVKDRLVLHNGDRIALGDSEVVFHDKESTSQFIAVEGDAHATNMAIRIDDDSDVRGAELASRVLSSLALEFLEDRPMSELFDFILDKVVGVLHPSRAAIGLFGDDRTSFAFVNHHLRRADERDSTDLLISRTLLKDVVEGRKIVSFLDAPADDRLARAESIIAQNIRSAVCAPLVVGDVVLGVLYIDFVSMRGTVGEREVRLLGHIARLAAVKLETTRLREESLAKAKIDEELRTAWTIQSRLLPAFLPEIDGYSFAGSNRPCKTVSGDYYDVVMRPDGRIYFVIADVSGKGVTAALIMSAVATAFGIFTRSDPRPADLLREMNLTLAPKTSPAKFVTMIAGVLDPATGSVEFANAGHVPPLVVSDSGARQLDSTDLVVGLFTHAQYRNQSLQLSPGDALVLFTDGVTEAENATEEQLGLAPIRQLLDTLHGRDASSLLDIVAARVHDYIGDVPAGDDVTMLAFARVR